MHRASMCVYVSAGRALSETWPCQLREEYPFRVQRAARRGDTVLAGGVSAWFINYADGVCLRYVGQVYKMAEGRPGFTCVCVDGGEERRGYSRRAIAVIWWAC